MLARRFTIVCLLITLFGMGLSVLVADRSMRGPVQSGFFTACNTATGIGCPLSLRR